METPRQLRSAADERDDITIAHRDYEDENVVGETAIVVVGDRQLEFEVPEEATEVTTNDGILLIRG